jgi:hypothetical protein
VEGAGSQPPFHTPVFVLAHRTRRRSRWKAARRSTSSTFAAEALETAARPRTAGRRNRRLR